MSCFVKRGKVSKLLGFFFTIAPVTHPILFFIVYSYYNVLKQGANIWWMQYVEIHQKVLVLSPLVLVIPEKKI